MNNRTWYRMKDILFKNLRDDVLNAVNNTLLEKEYATWEDFNVEVPVFRGGEMFMVVIWGETGEAETEWYSVSIRPADKSDEPWEIEGYLTKSVTTEELEKTLFRALKVLDRYLSTGTTKAPAKKKYRRGGHILSLDELARQEFVYWHYKITHRGWFCNWNFRMAAQNIGEHGCIFYAIAEEIEK